MGLVSLKGFYPIRKKITNGSSLEQIPASSFCSVPLKLKNIAESEPVVSVGNVVKQGTLLAKPAGRFGVNIYSPISGKVLNIFDRFNTVGEKCKHILIANDNLNQVCDLPKLDSPNNVTLITRLREAGIIDNVSNMPAYLKYAYVGARSYKTLIVLMDSTSINNSILSSIVENKMEEVVNGARYFLNITGANIITFVFTENNRKLANKLKRHIAETKKNYYYKIKFIPNKYPFDNPFILSKLVTGKTIDEKTSFLQMGISIETAESCYDFCRAVEFNKPVVSKVVTIDGSNVAKPGNYVVPNGMSYENVLDYVGKNDVEAECYLLDGDLLSGKAQHNKEISVSLNTDVLVLEKVDPFKVRKEYPCISCGKCASICPMFLNPREIELAYLNEDVDKLDKLQVQSCIECGCCSYVCPAKRFLTQRIVSAKVYHKKFKGAKNG